MPRLRGQVKCLLSSDNQTDSATIKTGPCAFGGIYWSVSEDVVFEVFDNTAASGKKVAPWNEVDEGMIVKGSQETWAYTVDPPIFCEIGIHVNIVSGENFGYIVVYDE